MALMNLPRPLTGGPGYKPGQQIPLSGSQAPQGMPPDQRGPWMASQPWFQAALKAWGIDPNHISLSIEQRSQLYEAASRAGMDTSSSQSGVDSSGRIEDVTIPTYAKVALSVWGAAAIANAAGAFKGPDGSVNGGGGASNTGLDYGSNTNLPQQTSSLTSGAYKWLPTALNTVTQLYGLKQQLDANGNAVTAQTDAAKYAADLQSKSQAAALAYEQQQAAQAQSNYETSQFGNYGQWAAREHRLGTLGDMVGLGPREIPAYVQPKNVTGGPTAATGTLGAMAGANTGQPAANFGNLNDPSAWMGLVGNPQQLSSWVKQGLGPNASPDLVNYYVGKVQGQPGANATEQAGSANYWLQKLQSDPVAHGGAQASPQGAYSGTSQPFMLSTLGSSLQPAQMPPTGTLAMPMPGTLGSYINQRVA